ncbi:MAG: DUF1015 family protein [Nocardioidaceae bacterium]
MDDSPVVPPPHLGRPLRLLPFRGLALSPRRVGDPAAIGALARPYRDAPARLALWERAGRLWRDGGPALYVHEYTVDGLSVRGLVGALDLSHRSADPSMRAVLPHEGVHPDQVDHLARRMRRMALNPAPILLVHRGPVAARELVSEATADEPLRTFSDRNGHRHRVWALREPDQWAELDRALADSTPVLADGHHRYTASLRLQQENPGTAWDLGLAMLVDQDDTPLFLGAIHRIVRGLRLEDFEAASGHGWAFRRQASDAAISLLGPETLVLTDGQSWATVTIDVPPSGTAVEVLHGTVLPSLAAEPTTVSYHHRVADALQHVRSRRDVAVLMPAADYDMVHDIVAGNRLLPEKATSFQPKPAFGVLMRSLRDG